MKIKASSAIILFILLGISSHSFAQAELDDDIMDLEVKDNDGVTNPTTDSPLPNELEQIPRTSPVAPRGEIYDSKPVVEQTYKVPPVPAKGGKFRVPHPGAAQGLNQITQSGDYLYKVPKGVKTKSASFRVGSFSPPKISGPNGLTFEKLYGRSNLTGALFDYDWKPFTKFGYLGLQLGGGLISARGNGRFADGGIAEEVYSFYILPLSAYAVYRFEYSRRQWFVPFINGGGNAFVFGEKRDDNKPFAFAGAFGVGFGGGAHLSISKWSQANAFILAREYGVQDLWLTGEFRVTQGLSSELDFSSRIVSLGITVDY